MKSTDTLMELLVDIHNSSHIGCVITEEEVEKLSRYIQQEKRQLVDECIEIVKWDRGIAEVIDRKGSIVASVVHTLEQFKSHLSSPEPRSVEECYCVCHSPYSSCPSCEHCQPKQKECRCNCHNDNCFPKYSITTCNHCSKQEKEGLE